MISYSLAINIIVKAPDCMVPNEAKAGKRIVQRSSCCMSPHASMHQSLWHHMSSSWSRTFILMWLLGIHCRPTGNGSAKEALGGSDTDTDDEETVAQRQQQQQQQEAEAARAAAAAAAPKPPAAAAPKKRPAGMAAVNYTKPRLHSHHYQNMASLMACSPVKACPHIFLQSTFKYPPTAQQ